MTRGASSPIGLHRVVSPLGVLPQAADVLDASPEIYDDEVRLDVQRLNLDAASFRQLREAYPRPNDRRRAVVEIIRTRGKMQNPVTGSGGMLIGVVDEVGPGSPLGLEPGQRVASLVSLTLTPLVISNALSTWDAESEQVPAEGHAILFGRSIAAPLPEDVPVPLALAALDVCGAPALVHRIASSYTSPRVAVIGAAGKSGSLACAAARRAGAASVVGVVPAEREAELLRTAALCDEVVVADARDAVTLAAAVGTPADITVVCVDVAGCEGGAVLATAAGGTVVFFSMATSFTAAALGAEGLAADITMIVGNGYVPGHAAMALDLVRTDAGVRGLFEARLVRETRPS